MARAGAFGEKRKRVRRSLLDGGAICTMRRIAVGNVDVPFVFIRQWLLRSKKKKIFFGSQPSGGLAELEIYRRSSIPNQVNETLTQHLNDVSSFFFFFDVVKRIRHKIKSLIQQISNVCDMKPSERFGQQTLAICPLPI